MFGLTASLPINASSNSLPTTVEKGELVTAEEEVL
jgi:hypothetical protein